MRDTRSRSLKAKRLELRNRVEATNDRTRGQELTWARARYEITVVPDAWPPGGHAPRTNGNTRNAATSVLERRARRGQEIEPENACKTP